MAALLERAQGTDDGEHLHAVVGGVGHVAAEHLFVRAKAQDGRPAAGAGIA